ncbi:PLxRFG domain-containing protein [Methylosinus sp. KRF6]|uniref:PLxRFG domain-containing protein n=1 Tax=Methylosinus sp. KRF6 TaxID=2846853 RepID=UPI001C0D97DB|nr:PLxRFG domain-containing protein [Methylosinus sp. KRF6]MBU3887635.1 PLxRFG domain-containing protein [Methylosinus sp. KRF6]
MVERRKVEAEIDARGAQAAKPAEANTAHEDWWERGLTGFGRKQAAERAGVQIPNDKVRWQYLSPEKQKALGALVGTERDPSKPAEEALLPVTDEKRAKAVEYAKRNWWGARPAAEAFIENNGLADTHEVKQEGRKFSAVPRAENSFVQFDKDSGTLGVPRAEMPQVAAEHHGALTNFLNAKGIDHETKEAPAEGLKPTQAEFSPEKVEKAKDAEGDRSVIVSNDGHVIDGHHQWLAAKDEGEQVKAIVLNAPVEKALEAVKEFPSATTSQESAPTDTAKGRWFGSRDKAEAFIEKKKLGASHEIKQVGKFRFDIVPKGANAEADRLKAVEASKELLGKKIDLTTPTQAEAAAPKKLSPKEKAAAERARVEDYFTPGNIVRSYGGGFDRVISFDWNNGDVRATVESVNKDGDKWVAKDRPRTHSTIPDRGDKIVEKAAVEPSEKPLGSDNTRDVSEGADAPGSHQGGDAKASLRAWMPDASEINLFHWNDPGNAGMNAEGLRDHLIRGKDGPLIQKLISSGRIVLHATADTLPGGAPNGTVQGMTTADGVIHLVADNLTPETARAVLLHEAFHAGAEALTGSRGWKSLMERIQTAVDKAVERGDVEGFWADALEQARASGGRLAEEAAAYAVENYERAPAGIKDIVDRLVGLAKAWAVRTFGRQFGSVTPAQLRALAVTALRSSANADGVNNVGSGDVRYSIASPRDVATRTGGLFDESRHALSDIITDLMTGKKSPSTSILGAVPVRPLFLELAKHLPSARLYLDTKQAMDAMRNKYARETDETLQRWFKFANKIARDGAKIYRRNVAENTALMDLMHESTIAQADPSKEWAGQENMTPADRDDMRRFRPGSERYDAALKKQNDDVARKAAWEDLKTRYDALSNEAKAIYVEVRESYKAMADRTEELVIQNVKQAAEAALTRAKRDHADAMTRIADDGLAGKERHDAVAAADRKLALAQTTGRRASAARIKRMREMFESNRLKGPYFPLARFGNYFVTVRDNGGKVISFSRFESVSDQKRFAKEQEAIAGQSVELGLVKKENEFKKIVDPTFMAKLDALFDDHGVGHEVRDQVWQRYLESLPDLSMRKHRIHRKNRAGFNNDALRAFAHTMFHGGHQLARLEYGIELQEHMDNIAEEVRASDDPVRSGAVYEEMKRAHDFTMNPQGEPWAYRLTSFAFLWTMAFNVSSALVNTEQTWSKGLGNLAFDIDTKAGRKEAFSQLARATKEFFIGKGFIENASTLTDDERAAIAKGYELGVIDKTQAHDLASMVETGVSYNPLWNYMMKAASAPMHHTERFNREVTFLAAYRIARDKGLSQEQAIKKASDLTWMTHYDNQSSSKSRMMRGDVARVVFALKSYQANVLFRLFYDIHQSMHAKTADERKMAIGRTTTMLAMSLPIAGLSGAFGFHTLMTIAAFFMGLAGNDDDPDEELRRIMLQMTGDSIIGRAVGGMIMDGAPGYITGTALSDRIGNADLWFRSNNMEMNPEQKWEYLLEQLGGATFGLAHQIYQGGVDVAKGNVERGLEKMAPAFIKNPAKAVRYAMEGVQDKNENPIVEYVPWQDIMKQAAGFTPAEIRERMDRNTFQRNMQTRIHGEKSAALRAAGRARMGGDQSAIEAAQKKVDAYNAEVPEARITPKSIMQEAKRFKKKHDRMEFGVDLDPKLEDRIKEGTAPSIYAR